MVKGWCYFDFIYRDYLEKVLSSLNVLTTNLLSVGIMLEVEANYLGIFMKVMNFYGP